MALRSLAVKTTNEQILPHRLALVAFVVAVLPLSACGLDADEETSTATTPAPITSGATGPSGPSGPSGPTGPTGESGNRDATSTP